MKIRYTIFATLLLSLTLTGCGGVKVWPFNDDKSAGRASGPANATEYKCEGGKRFFVRLADKGATAWLIYPDREVSLAKSPTGNSYTNGIAVLEINGSEASLKEGDNIAYSGCSSAAKAVAKEKSDEAAK